MADAKATGWEIGDEVRWVAAEAGELRSYFYGRVVRIIETVGGVQEAVIRVADGRASLVTIGGNLLFESDTERDRMRAAVDKLLTYVPRFNGIPPELFERQLNDFKAEVLSIIDGPTA